MGLCDATTYSTVAVLLTGIKIMLHVNEPNFIVNPNVALCVERSFSQIKVNMNTTYVHCGLNTYSLNLRN